MAGESLSKERNVKPTIVIAVIITLSHCLPAWADCPFDHFIIGCNRDGIEGTPDDRTLFVDCEHKYRNSGPTHYDNWFYPLAESIFASYRYRIGEPGFDVFQADNPSEEHTYDPNRSLVGVPDRDYRVTVECVALSTGLRAVHKDYPQFTLDAVGQTFDHSTIHSLRGDSHIHMSYQATDDASLHWISFRALDSLDDGDAYEPSEPFTIVFNVQPLAGDLAIDGVVGPPDLARLSRLWLSPESGRCNDYCERADTDRDGAVNLFDFARMAANWRTTGASPHFFSITGEISGRNVNP